MRSNFDFSDVNLIPQMGIVESRSECNTEVYLGKTTFKLPIIPANMESVINEALAIKLATGGYFYIMHRFGVDNIKFINMMKRRLLIASVSIGVNKDAYDFIDYINENPDSAPEYITIDIAHGHCIKMKELLIYIKSKNIKSFIIAGNISTVEAAEDLVKWGANAIKVGIAPGLVCTTAHATSFGSRGIQASVVRNIAQEITVPVIADGGIREHGDIAVALTMGATMVMTGGMLTGFEDSPGHVIENNGILYKEYWGSASQFQGGKSERIEGTKTLVKMKQHSILDEYKRITDSLQSAISYAGGLNLNAFKGLPYIVREK